MRAFLKHGGRLAAAMRAWPAAPQPWIDLSTGINPWPYPAPRASRAARAGLPDPEAVAALEAVAARSFGVADPAQVLATPGAEAAIRLLPHLTGAETVWIKGPTYGGHAAAWRISGRRLVGDPKGAAVHVVVNPNNPDGSIEALEALLDRADALAARDGWLVVDESFIDAGGAASLAPLGLPRALVLRSFGKFFGLAGLRLGFLIGDPDLIERARRLQGDWAISADAIAAGRAAYADRSWPDRIRTRLARTVARLDAALERTGFDLVGGTPLFRLARIDDAHAQFAALCAHGILTRPFTDDPRWLRFGLPSARAWPRFAAALRSLV